MTTQCYAMVRGRVARFTLLDRRGTPIQGPASVVVTKGIATVEINESVETESDELLRNETDDPRIMLRGKNHPLGFLANIRLTKVDPDLISMLTNQSAVLNASGDAVGNDVNTRRITANFAMEVWTKLDRSCGEGYQFGYTLFPRLRGGRLGGFSFENGAVTFTITGARTARMSKWGLGPYSLRRDGGGWNVGPWDVLGWDESAMHERLGTPVGSHLHWRTMLLDRAPEPTCGAQPLYDVIDGGTAAVTTPDIIDGGTAPFTTPDIIDGGMA